MHQKSKLLQTGVELVRLERGALQRIKELQFFRYSIKIPPSVMSRFDNLIQAYYHVENLFRAKHLFSSLLHTGDGINIVSPIETKEPFLYSFGKEEERYKIGITQLKEPFNLDFTDSNHLRIFFRLFYQSLRNSLRKQGYSIKGMTVFDRKTDLLSECRHYSTNELFAKIQKFIHLFPAFNFQLRRFGNDFFIQISPRSLLEFEKDLYTLQTEDFLSVAEYTKTFESVTLSVFR